MESAPTLAVAGVRGTVVAATGDKLAFREGNPAEHLAGVLPAAWAVAALLGGNAVIQHRHQQLSIPLQPDDGELAQGHLQNPLRIPGDQLLIKEAADPRRNLGNGTMMAALPNLGAENHRIQHLHH